MNKIKHFIQSRIASFSYAFQGIVPVVKHECNMRIHIVAAIAVIAAGLCFNLQAWEWICVTIAIGTVFTAEFFNSAIETLANVVCKEKNADIKKVKDIAAAAVLMSAIAAAVIGCIIFVPKF
ncbi:MAG: diacylglycerol kinase family protein [Bacteroidales bacterium]|jgi:diacylglycerol kinase|nr:diacylglycerol kinase family protein [Bacteroidales bacterium]